MVQDQLPAFRNGNALVSVDQFKIGEPDVYSLFDEQCGVVLVHNSQLLLQRVLVFYSYQLSAEGGCQSEDCSDVVSSAYPSYIFA